jgi:hypothetical protein
MGVPSMESLFTHNINLKIKELKQSGGNLFEKMVKRSGWGKNFKRVK